MPVICLPLPQASLSRHHLLQPAEPHALRFQPVMLTGEVGARALLFPPLAPQANTLFRLIPARGLLAAMLLPVTEVRRVRPHASLPVLLPVQLHAHAPALLPVQPLVRALARVLA